MTRKLSLEFLKYNQKKQKLNKTREDVTPVISHKLDTFLMFRLNCMYPYLGHDIQVGSGVGRAAPRILCSQTSDSHKELEEVFYSSAQPDNPVKQELKERQAKFQVTLHAKMAMHDLLLLLLVLQFNSNMQMVYIGLQFSELFSGR